MNKHLETGVIIVDHGSKIDESNQLVMEVVKLFRLKFREKFLIVEVAHMEISMPSIQNAYQKCIEAGSKKIIVSPFFLGTGKHWTQDIPCLTKKASEKYPGAEFYISRPLGLDMLIVDILEKRIRETELEV